MIQSPQDLAELLADMVRRETAGESLPSTPRLVAFVSPPQAVFVVRTVEGREYEVRVQETP
jgi:hypothetical protein